MRKLQTIGYVYSYTDTGDNCDGYPRISKLYKTLKGCKRAMLLDANEYAIGTEECQHGGEVYDKGDKIEVEFECGYNCLYAIHEVKVSM